MVIFITVCVHNMDNSLYSFIINLANVFTIILHLNNYTSVL